MGQISVGRGSNRRRLISVAPLPLSESQEIDWDWEVADVLVRPSGHTHGIVVLKKQKMLVCSLSGSRSLSTSVRARGPPACPKENRPYSS